MYSEIGFIFSPALGGFGNSDNTGNIYGRPIKIAPAKTNQNTSQGQTTQTNQGQTGQSPTPGSTIASADDGMLIYKNPNASGTLGIRNYLVDNVYKYDNSNEDPYISLIRYFGDRKVKALTLKAGDFAYLKDLGVYPINRLWILRRFPDNCIVPSNLLSWGQAVQPVSTVIGWMKDKEDNPMMTLNFNEVWVDQNEMIDKVMTTILKDEFGLKLPAMMSVPGWSQGILFGMLKAAGLTDDFDSKNVPTGNPNVLRVAKMREINGQGLKSNMSFSLETCYEQKYINGVDPGLAMLDIISNLLKMGTSDQRFVLGASPALTQLMGNLNSQTQSLDAWMELIKKLISAFMQGVTNFISEMSNVSSETTKEESSTGGTDEKQDTKVQLGTPIASKTVLDGIGGFVMGVASSLLNGTIAKYRWPLKGSVALMSGISTTPWHLTIGNPYSPIVNIGNIVITNVEVKLSNDLGFNDMPARIDATLTAEFGRPLGKQELEKMFNNGYKRVYSKKLPGSESKDAVSNTTASGISASMNVATKEGQPDGTVTKIVSTAGGLNLVSVNTGA